MKREKKKGMFFVLLIVGIFLLIEIILAFNVNVVFNAPMNNSIFSRENISLNITVFNDGDLNVTVWFYGDSDELDVIHNVTNGTVLICDWVNLTDGNHNWSVVVNNESVNYTSKTRFFTVDTIPPFFEIISPENIMYNSRTILLNLSSDGVYLAYNWNGTNITYLSPINITFDEGQNILYAGANDSAGNENITNIIFTVDTISPSLNINVPSRYQEFPINVSIPLNFTVNDANLNSCWYNIDGGTNVSIPCGNAFFNATEGEHTLYLFANDTIGNERRRSKEFTISMNAPAINLNCPSLWNYLNHKTNVYLNYTPEDINGLDSCTIWNNFDGNFKPNETNYGVVSGIQDFSVFNISSDGGYTWNVWCNDSLGNGRFSEHNFTFTVDTIVPLISYGFGTKENGINLSQSNIYVNVSVVELNEQRINFVLYDSVEEIDEVISWSELRSVNWTDLEDGIYYYNVSILDKADHVNFTETRMVRLDTTPPNVFDLIPIENDFNPNEEIEIGVHVTDFLAVDKVYANITYPNSSCLLLELNYFEGNKYNNSFILDNSEGEYNVNFIANDSFNHINGSKSLRFNASLIDVLINLPLEIENVSKLETKLNVSLSKNGELWYNLNGGENITLCLDCNAFETIVNFTGYGMQTIVVYVRDNGDNLNNVAFNFTLNLDSDGDGIPDVDDDDDDNDGIPDEDDLLSGNVSNVLSNFPDFNLTIGESYNCSQQFNGSLPVDFYNGEEKIVSFDFNFSGDQHLVLGNVLVLKQGDSSTGSLIVKGIDLSSVGVTKTVYIDNLDSSKTQVCIRDEEISSINEVSGDCSSAGEVLLSCPGNSGGYSCEINGSRYKVSGLTHSGIVQMLVEYVKERRGGGSSSSSSDEEEEIKKIILEKKPVEEGNKTIQMNLSLSEYFINVSNSLNLLIDFENLFDSGKDVDLTFSIFDEEMNKIYFDEDDIYVDEIVNYEKNFEELNLVGGVYTLLVEVSYSDFLGRYPLEFKFMEEKSFISKMLNTFILYGIIILTLVVFLVVYWFKKNG